MVFDYLPNDEYEQLKQRMRSPAPEPEPAPEFNPWQQAQALMAQEYAPTAYGYDVPAGYDPYEVYQRPVEEPPQQGPSEADFGAGYLPFGGQVPGPSPYDAPPPAFQLPDLPMASGAQDPYALPPEIGSFYSPQWDQVPPAPNPSPTELDLGAGYVPFMEPPKYTLDLPPIPPLEDSGPMQASPTLTGVLGDYAGMPDPPEVEATRQETARRAEDILQGIQKGMEIGGETQYGAAIRGENFTPGGSPAAFLGPAMGPAGFLATQESLARGAWRAAQDLLAGRDVPGQALGRYGATRENYPFEKALAENLALPGLAANVLLDPGAVGIARAGARAALTGARKAAVPLGRAARAGAEGLEAAGRTVGPHLASEAGYVKLPGAAAEAPTKRYYHGTGSAFDAPDAANFDPNALYGPGYYLTDAGQVGSRYSEAMALSKEDRSRLVALEKEIGEAKARESWSQDTWNTIPAWQRKYYPSVEELAKQRDELLGSTTGANVRAVDVPNSLNLLDVDAPIDRKAANRIGALLKAQSQDPEPIQVYRKLLRNAETNQDIYDALKASTTWDAGWLSVPEPEFVNKLLADAGYDGIRYSGGQIMPIHDAAGNAIEHEAIAIFPESLPKIRNAISGTPMGTPPEIGFGVAGGVASAVTTPEDADDQELGLRTAIGAGVGLLGGRAMRRIPKLPGGTSKLGATAGDGDIVLGKTLSDYPEQEDIIQRVLRREQEKGRPALAIDDVLYLRDGKYRIERDQGGMRRLELRKMHELSETGLLKGMEEGFDDGGQFASYNQAAKEMIDNVRADREAARLAREAEEQTAREESGRAQQEYVERRMAIDEQYKATKFKKASVEAPTINEGQTIHIEGPSIGGLIVSKDPNVANPKYANYVITHVGSGKQVGRGFDSLTEAKVAAMRLANLTDWTRPAEEIVANKEVGAAVKALLVDGPYAKLPGETPRPSVTPEPEAMPAVQQQLVPELAPEPEPTLATTASEDATSASTAPSTASEAADAATTPQLTDLADDELAAALAGEPDPARARQYADELIRRKETAPATTVIDETPALADEAQPTELPATTAEIAGEVPAVETAPEPTVTPETPPSRFPKEQQAFIDGRQAALDAGKIKAYRTYTDGERLFVEVESNGGRRHYMRIDETGEPHDVNKSRRWELIEERTKEAPPAETVGAGAGEPPPVRPTTEGTPPGGEYPEKEGFAANIRLSKYVDENRQDILREYARENPARVQEMRRGIRSDAQVLEDAKALMQELGGDANKLVKRWQVGQAWNAEELTAIRGALNDRAGQIVELRAKLKAGDDGEITLLRLAKAIEEHRAVQDVVHGVTAEAGSALRSFRQDVVEALTNPEAAKINRLLKRYGSKGDVRRIAAALANADLDNPDDVYRFVQNMTNPKINDYLTELFYNSILSGPRTHVVNTLSNTLTALGMVPESLASATVEAGLSRVQQRPAQRFFGESGQIAFGLLQGLPEGVRAVLYTARHGFSPQMASKWEFRPKAFSAATPRPVSGLAGAWIGGAAGGMQGDTPEERLRNAGMGALAGLGFGAASPRLTGRAISLPSTALEAADTFFRAVNHRAALNAEAYRMARNEGLKGRAIAERIADLKLSPPAELLERAGHEAEYRLFRQAPGEWTQKIIGLRDAPIVSVTPLKFVLPFIQTPANLLKYGMERSPLGILNPHLYANLAAKDPKAADQLARTMIGSLTAAALAYYLWEDKITGAAPRDKAERDRFYASGKQPFAFRVGDQWISYRRMEPFNQTFAQVAAVTEAIKKGKQSPFEIAADVAQTIGKNFVSQEYVAGLADVMDAIEDPERYGNRVFERFTSAVAVPFSSATRTFAQMTDKTVRQPGGETFGEKLGETIKAGVPGLSKEVPAKLTALGEEVTRESPEWSPINVTGAKDDPVNKELTRLDVNVAFVPKKMTVDKQQYVLSREQMDAYQRMVGQTLKEGLARLVNDPRWEKLSDKTKKELIEDVQGRLRRVTRENMAETLPGQAREGQPPAKSVAELKRYAVGYVDALTEYAQYQALPKWRGIPKDKEKLVADVGAFLNKKQQGSGKRESAFYGEAVKQFGQEALKMYRNSRSTNYANPERRDFWRKHPGLREYFPTLAPNEWNRGLEQAALKEAS